MNSPGPEAVCLRVPVRDRDLTLDPAPMIFSKNMIAKPKSVVSELFFVDGLFDVEWRMNLLRLMNLTAIILSLLSILCFIGYESVTWNTRIPWKQTNSRGDKRCFPETRRLTKPSDLLWRCSWMWRWEDDIRAEMIFDQPKVQSNQHEILDASRTGIDVYLKSLLCPSNWEIIIVISSNMSVRL